jgi:hypothetical protein
MGRAEMIDLDDLREALKSPPGEWASAPDVGHILLAGRRLRRRRRVRVSVISMAAAFVLLTTGVLVGQSAGHAPLEKATTPRSALTLAPTPTSASPSPTGSPLMSPASGPLNSPPAAASTTQRTSESGSTMKATE